MLGGKRENFMIERKIERNMNPSKPSLMLTIVLVLSLFSGPASATIHKHKQFLQCLLHKSSNSSSILNAIYAPTNPSYTSILESGIQNLLFNTTQRPKPLAIITPPDVSHIQATVICARENNVQIRIRSGGHDYEGLSYISPLPFLVLDLINLRNISVDVENKVSWVETGASIGELYYRIAEKSKTLAFPAGTCPTVGVGGHLTGGGFGFLLRKYGLAADHILDAILVDANGRVLDRSSMGEDLFWAIRGGGGQSFGVVVAWKVNLVPVPSTITFFRVPRLLEQNATQLLHRWQYVANKLPDDITMFAFLFNFNSTRVATFLSLYLGEAKNLIPLMEERFPELGLKQEDCIEMSWIEAQMALAGYPSNASSEILLHRINLERSTFKAKSDYVKEPLSAATLESLVKRFSDNEIKNSMFFMVPYGGKMGEIAETSIPFPHRAGNLFMMVYEVAWTEQGLDAAKKHKRWIRKIYKNMAPHVSKNPRGAYFNYRDLDIGSNNMLGITSYRRARIWGTKYFKNNFDRLVQVKTRVDPTNFFRNEQSIPPFSPWRLRFA